MDLARREKLRIACAALGVRVAWAESLTPTQQSKLVRLWEWLDGERSKRPPAEPAKTQAEPKKIRWREFI